MMQTHCMRVAQIARLTGTTVRTVRYYHSLGLLPVPEERGGWRDYELSHAARLSRIRWLTRAGIPLETIARVLDAEPATDPGDEADDENLEQDARARDRTDDAAPAPEVVTDLSAALRAVEGRLAEVARQRDMLAGLLQRAEEGLTVCPMSARMVAFFDRLERAAPDERTRSAVRHDRDVVDLACYCGRMPPEAEDLFPEPDKTEDAAALVGYGRDLDAATQGELTEHADWVVSRLEGRLTPDRAQCLARQTDIGAVRSLYRLIADVDPRSARLAPLVEQRLVRTIERWRSV